MDNTSYYWDVIFESNRQFFLSWIYDLPTSDIQVLRGYEMEINILLNKTSIGGGGGDNVLVCNQIFEELIPNVVQM